LAAILAGFEFTGLPYLMRFAGESAGYASLKCGFRMSVHCCRMGPASNGIHLKKQPLIQPQPAGHRKKKLSLTVKMVSQLLKTHQPVLFRATTV
jgi:hypothetical protein